MLGIFLLDMTDTFSATLFDTRFEFLTRTSCVFKPLSNYVSLCVYFLSLLLSLSLLLTIFFKNGPNPASFLFIFGLFKQAIQFLQQINVKNVMSIQYPVPGFEPTTFGM